VTPSKEGFVNLFWLQHENSIKVSSSSIFFEIESVSSSFQNGFKFFEIFALLTTLVPKVMLTNGFDVPNEIK
jgi:hypothetical protein